MEQNRLQDKNFGKPNDQEKKGLIILMVHNYVDY